MTDRRRFLATAAAASAVLLLPSATKADAMDDSSFPPIPTTPTPGNPGDFDFLTGEWRIRNRRAKAPGDWDEFPGEATVTAIMGGRGSVEDLRIPARDFAGLGLRLLDAGTRIWVDHWVNARSGVVTVPGQSGSFENGAGIFTSTYEDAGRTMTAMGVWDSITPTSCRWRQAVSADGGRTWELNWLMHWTRV